MLAKDLKEMLYEACSSAVQVFALVGPMLYPHGMVQRRVFVI